MNLAEVFAGAIAACDPAAATRRALAGLGLRPRPTWVAAVGKAAATMARGVGEVRGGLVVVPACAEVRAPLVMMRASHPVPDASSERAGRALLALAAAIPPHHRMLALISGGASSLAAVPSDGVRLPDKVAAVRAAMAAGAPIAALNALRTSMSAIKGGRLAARASCEVVTIVCSDVVGDDPAIVGSGPTVPCHRVVVASGIGDLARAAARVSGGVVIDAAMVGDVADCAGAIVRGIERGPGTWIWAGEPTIALPESPGRGGRARHLALLVARALAGRAGWSLLAAGSDGIDGTGDAAGAIVDGATWHPSMQGALDRADSGTALAPVALVTGPTGVNHTDLYVAHVV